MLASVLLCKCGSPAVDVNGWKSSDVATLRCYTCGNEAQVRGFTVGRTETSFAAMANAMRDKASCRVNIKEEGR